MHLIKVMFQRVDVDRPEAAELSEPGVYLHQRLRFYPVQAPLRFNPRLDESGFTKHPQVL